ncbi:uncharacterized protein BYT42DRAFT_619855 [Radiomyces spectabilis]|uniref:uncharacterized protein n=1 Tax=Radiomyces spectabilis TaxID=64574 RepID=UPI00221F93A3|nr:uncharacterized protein BYT42DRAFT_619855 [Radiomyces spectabilis]KAI8393702.1 hypothetical protein BYT42DRAFT_619855 [Radiomyces spectabilis]
MSNTQQPIKVGIIGTGIFAYRHLRAYQALGAEKYQLVACANRSRDKAVKFAAEAGIPESAIYSDPLELINDPNVELIDTLLPVQYNRGIVEAAIAANKHIIFEKPIAASLEDARKIVLAARKAKTVVAVAENWAYHPLVTAVGSFIEKGGIGEIVNFTYDSTRPYSPNSPYYATNWRMNPEHPGGYLSDGGVHDMCHLKIALGWFDTVSAFTTKRHTVHGADDTLASTVRLKNGAIGVANFTFCSAGMKSLRLEIHGTNGSIILKNDTDVELFNEQGESVDTQYIKDLAQEVSSGGFTDVEGELYNLYQTLRHGAKLGISIDDCFHHLAFFIAALESAREMKAVKLPEIEE